MLFFDEFKEKNRDFLFPEEVIPVKLDDIGFLEEIRPDNRPCETLIGA